MFVKKYYSKSILHTKICDVYIKVECANYLSRYTFWWR